MKEAGKTNKTIWIVIAVVAIIVLIFYFYPSGNGNNQEGENQEETGYIDVSPAEAKALIDNNPELIIIDVSPDYDDGHLPGAVNYYLGDGSLDEAIPTLDKQAMYLVYCHVFTASSSGAQKLIDAGFENVYRLDGEYDAWIDAGYEIEY